MESKQKEVNGIKIGDKIRRIAELYPEAIIPSDRGEVVTVTGFEWAQGLGCYFVRSDDGGRQFVENVEKVVEEKHCAFKVGDRVRRKAEWILIQHDYPGYRGAVVTVEALESCGKDTYVKTSDGATMDVEYIEKVSEDTLDWTKPLRTVDSEMSIIVVGRHSGYYYVIRENDNPVAAIRVAPNGIVSTGSQYVENVPEEKKVEPKRATISVGLKVVAEDCGKSRIFVFVGVDSNICKLFEVDSDGHLVRYNRWSDEAFQYKQEIEEGAVYGSVKITKIIE